MPWRRIDLAIWAVFGVVWVVAAPFSFRTVKREDLRQRLAYGIPLAVGLLILFSERVPLVVEILRTRVLPDADVFGAAGVGLTALGVAFAIWARAHLGRLWSGTITLKENHKLVQSGPYGIARHPIYTGVVVGLMGTLLVVGTVAAILGVTIAMGALVAKLGREEALMAGQFGDEHRAYRERVKRLIPFVW